MKTELELLLESLLGHQTAAVVLSPIVYTAYIIWKTPDLEDGD